MNEQHADGAQQAPEALPVPPKAFKSQVDVPLPEIKLAPRLYYFLVALALAIYAILISLSVLFWSTSIWSWEWIKFDVGPGLILLVVAHLIASFAGKSVPLDGFGVLLFYGKALMPANSGPHFVPFLLVQLRILDNAQQIIQVQAPADPNDVFWGDEDEALPPGMSRPIFFNTRSQNPGDKKNLDVQMTVGVMYYIISVITDPIVFLIRVGSVENARILLRDFGDSALNEDFATRTVNDAIEKVEEINSYMDDRVRKSCGGTGLTVTKAHVTKVNLSHKLAIAMRDRAAAPFAAETVVIQARSLADSKIIDAQAEAASITLKAKADAGAELKDGAAKAAAELLMLQARGAGLQDIKNRTGASGEAVLTSETAREVLPHAKATFVGLEGGIKDMLGMVSAGASVLKLNPEPEKSEEGA